MADRARVYAGTYDGVQVLSVHDGACEQVSSAFPGEVVQAVWGCQTRPQRVFAGLKAGLQRTDDGGLHWARVLDGDVRSVTIDPTDDNVIYAGGEFGNIGGQTRHRIAAIDTGSGSATAWDPDAGTTGSYVYSSPAAWGGRVFFGSYNGVFYGVSASSGRNEPRCKVVRLSKTPR